MRYPVPIQSNNRGANTSAYGMWSGISSSKSSQNSSRKSSSGRVTSTNAQIGRRSEVRTEPAEERQETTIGEHQRTEDEEYRILYDEIDRIDHILRSGRPDLIGKISLTSTFNKEAEISPSMQEKIMRLIKAMVPSSTPQQKDAFIRDLFDMGIRVGRNNPNRSHAMQREPPHVTAYRSTGEIKVYDSSSIGESLERVSTSPTYDYYDDGSNSIIEKPSKGETEGDSIMRQFTNSSDAVDARWEHLRNKALSDNSSKTSTGSHSLSTGIEAELIQDCVDTGMESLQGCRPTPKNGERGSIHHRVLPKCTSGTSSSHSHPQIMNSMELYETEDESRKTEETANRQKRPGQADDTSDHQPMQLRHGCPDSFDSDAASNSILADDDDMEMSNIPSFDEGSRRRKQVDETGADPQQQGGEFFDTTEPAEPSQREESEITTTKKSWSSSEIPNQGKAPENSEETLACEESYSKIEVTLLSSSEADSSASETRSSTTENVNNDAGDCFIAEESIGDSDAIVGDELEKDLPKDHIGAKLRRGNDKVGKTATGHSTSLIHVKSSLTIGTDFPSPENDEETEDEIFTPTPPPKQDYSFFQSVDLSVGETDGESFCTKQRHSEGEIVPSWRLNPSESLSDVELQILGVETGEATSYFVHKHIMAVGLRSSGYMNEAFCSENASTFQVTLDEKTSALIPHILDFMYCHEHDIAITTESAVALRQLGKMLNIVPLEVKASNFILKDLEIGNSLSQYVADGCYFNDKEVMKAVVDKCSTNIGTIPITDRLWIAMEPELFLRIVSSPYIDRAGLSKHLSLLLKEYLELHQYEIDIDLFSTLTSEKIIPIVDRDAAMPLIELCQFYESRECEALQKRCAYTVACYWKTTPQTDRQRLFSLLRNLPSSLTVDFLEIVESGKGTQEKMRNQMERKSRSSSEDIPKPKSITIHDFCGSIPIEGFKKPELSWRLDPEKSYSDWELHVKYLNQEGGVQIYNVHKHILAVGHHKGSFFAQNFDSKEAKESTAGGKGCTTIVLDCEAASVVPIALDFIYSKGKKIEISHENSVPLHYVARVLGISTLIEKAINFIGKNLSVANVVDYIIDAGYYKDEKTLSMATRLCAKDITSISVDSEILTDIQSDVFEKMVSCDEIDQKAHNHINILITKYFSLHHLEGKAAEKLLKCIALDRIEHHSATVLLKLLNSSKNYQGIEKFEKMKEVCAYALTENWSDLTSDDNQRQEIFSMFPSLNSQLLTVMFDLIDRKYRTDRAESTVLQTQLVKRFRAQAAEAERLQQEEVSNLQRELEERTAKMLSLQKALEGQLDQVDRALNRRTARSTAALTSAPSPRNAKRISTETIMVIANDKNLPPSPHFERQVTLTDTEKHSEVDLDWYQDHENEKGRRLSMQSKKNNNEGSVHSTERSANRGEEKQQQQSITNDQQSVAITNHQVKKGLMSCC